MATVTQDVGAGEGPRWLKSEAGTLESISEEGKVAQIDPRRFCQFLLDECLSRGVVLHQPAKVVGIAKDKKGILASVKVREDSGREIDSKCPVLIREYDS